MEASKPLIESQNMPLWIAAAFILALLALVAASVGLYRVQVSAALTQAEILTLNRHLQDIRKNTVAVAPQQSVQGAAPAPAAPAAK